MDFFALDEALKDPDLKPQNEKIATTNQTSVEQQRSIDSNLHLINTINKSSETFENGNKTSIEGEMGVKIQKIFDKRNQRKKLNKIDK